MSRLIDADALLEKYNVKDTNIAECLTDKKMARAFERFCIIADAVEEQPTVDAVPVVRCKYCVNWDEEYSSGRKSLGNYRCVCHEWSNEEDGFYRYTAEDDYCSCGERRTE